jgi:hypothetical protein
VTDGWGNVPPRPDWAPQPTGWGPPPPGWGPPPKPPRPTWLAPLAVLLAATLAVLGGAVLLRDRAGRPGTGPAAVAPATRPARPTHRAVRPTPRAVRTYSAPPDGVPVTGRVVDGAGQPVAGAGVRITRHEGFVEGFARGVMALATLGLACLADVCTVPYEQGMTDERGAYTVYLPKAPDHYEVSVGVEDYRMYGGDFDFRGTATALPEVVLWAPAPRVTVSGTTARVGFAAVPRRAGVATNVRVAVTSGAHDDVVTIDPARSGAAFDARLVEDQAADVEVRVRVRTPRFGEVTYVGTTTMRGTFVPVSRGRPCYEYRAPSGPAVRNDDCGLTDGDLDGWWTPVLRDSGCTTGPCERAVAVDLGSVRPVHHVVVHGCSWDRGRIQLSNDRRTWRTARSGCSGPVTGRARFVRIVGPGGGFYTGYSELSVF